MLTPCDRLSSTPLSFVMAVHRSEPACGSRQSCSLHSPAGPAPSFLQGFYVFIRALQLMKSHNEGVIVVGLAGASGSGKTAFSEKVSCA